MAEPGGVIDPQGLSVQVRSSAPKREGGERVSVKWDSRNLRTISTHLRKDEAEELRRICAAQHMTPYAMLREYLRDYIRLHRYELQRRP